jgi:hypothetical protein
MIPSQPSYQDTPRGEPFRAGSLALSPPWLRDYVGSRYMFTNGLMWDTLAELLRIGVIQRFPTVAGSEALGYLGRDRKIWRGISETDAAYAERLRQFKSTWKFAGNAPTLLRQLWAFMGTDCVRIRYVCNGYSDPDTADASTQFADWWTIDDTGLVFERVSPSNWDWDGSYTTPAQLNPDGNPMGNIRFWIIVYRTDFSPIKWGAGPVPWGETDLKWGSGTSDTSWIIDTFNIVQAFKAAGSHMGTFPSYNGGLIVADPDFTAPPWDNPLGPFDPSYAPGYPMPGGTFNDIGNYPPGAVFLSGL